jgi:hypothetical protein
MLCLSLKMPPASSSQCNFLLVAQQFINSSFKLFFEMLVSKRGYERAINLLKSLIQINQAQNFFFKEK